MIAFFMSIKISFFKMYIYLQNKISPNNFYIKNQFFIHFLILIILKYNTFQNLLPNFLEFFYEIFASFCYLTIF